MRIARCLLVSFIVSACGELPAAEPDPAALLLEVKQLADRQPDGFRKGIKGRIAIAEYLIGDQESARKQIAEVLVEVKNEKDFDTRLGIYADLIMAHQKAGLKEGAYDAIRAAYEDEQAASAEVLRNSMTLKFFHISPVGFYAFHNDPDSALRFIEAIRGAKAATQKEIETKLREDREFLQLNLIRLLLSHGHKDSAERALRKVLADSPDFSKKEERFAAVWYGLGRLEEGRRDFDLFLENSSASERFTLPTFITEAAVACAEAGQPDEARRLLGELKKLTPYLPSNRFRFPGCDRSAGRQTGIGGRLLCRGREA